MANEHISNHRGHNLTVFLDEQTKRLVITCLDCSRDLIIFEQKETSFEKINRLTHERDLARLKADEAQLELERARLALTR